MLNLRQSGISKPASSAEWETQSTSRFSIAFRAPSDLLGNIGEPLDHGQSERLHDDAHADDMSEGSDALETVSSMSEHSDSVGEGTATGLGDHDEDPYTVFEVARDTPKLEMHSADDSEVSARSCTA